MTWRKLFWLCSNSEVISAPVSSLLLSVSPSKVNWSFLLLCCSPLTPASLWGPGFSTYYGTWVNMYPIPTLLLAMWFVHSSTHCSVNSHPVSLTKLSRQRLWFASDKLGLSLVQEVVAGWKRGKAATSWGLWPIPSANAVSGISSKRRMNELGRHSRADQLLNKMYLGLPLSYSSGAWKQ